MLPNTGLEPAVTILSITPWLKPHVLTYNVTDDACRLVTSAFVVGRTFRQKPLDYLYR